jgi:hypothetical protein
MIQAKASFTPGKGPKRPVCSSGDKMARILRTAAYAAILATFAVGCGPHPNVRGRAAHPDCIRLNLAREDLLFGVRDDNAPNKILREWVRPGAKKPTQRMLPPELLQKIKDDSAEVLDLRDCELDDETKPAIARLRNLKWLRLPTTTTSADLEWIGQLTELRGLALVGADLRGANLAALDHLKELQWLSLSMAKMGDEEFETLPYFTRLEYLGLEGVTDAWLLHLVEARLPRLRSLSLDHSNFTDRGLIQLCDAYRYDLEFINLYRVDGISSASVSSGSA